MDNKTSSKNLTPSNVQQCSTLKDRQLIQTPLNVQTPTYLHSFPCDTSQTNTSSPGASLTDWNQTKTNRFIIGVPESLLNQFLTNKISLHFQIFTLPLNIFRVNYPTGLTKVLHPTLPPPSNQTFPNFNTQHSTSLPHFWLSFQGISFFLCCPQGHKLLVFYFFLHIATLLLPSIFFLPRKE